MSVWYLDLDDEITDAVARLRAAKDGKVVLVLPPGSRIGTGRINFRLLAREAETRGLTVALVSADPQVRALSASAGLTSHASVADAERALGLEVDQEAPAGARSTTAVSGIPPAARVSTAVNATDAATASSSGAGSEDAAGGKRRGSLLHRRHREGYAVTPRTATAAAAADGTVAVIPLNPGEGARIVRRGPSTKRRVATWGVRGAVAGALGAGALYVAFLTLPTATVSLVPGTTQLPPTDVTIVASPATVDVDPAAGAIHADWRSYPLQVTDSFAATGTENVLTHAAGEVRIVSRNTVTQVAIPADTVIRTTDGREYRTQRAVRLEKWSGRDGDPRPSVDVAVEAVKAGEAGNANRNSLTELPAAYRNLALDVTNTEPVTGGSSTREPRVNQRDCDTARAALDAALRESLAQDLAQGPSPGMELFEESADLGSITFSRPCSALVGQTVESFELTASATASALEVDESVLEAVAEEHFRVTREGVGTIEPDSIVATRAGEPVVGDGQVSYPMSVTAQVTRTVDLARIREEIAGEPVEIAKQILLTYGDATLVMWPEFVPTVPTDGSRIIINLPQ